MPSNANRLLPICLGLFIGLASFDLPAKDNPYLIHSDSADFLMKQQRANYYGHASIQQNNTRISGDTIRIKYKQKSQQIDELTATGQPATYQSKQHPQHPALSAQAQRIHYVQTTHQITLSGNASIQRGKDHMKADTIVLDTQNKRAFIPGKSQQHTTTLFIGPAGEIQ